MNVTTRVLCLTGLIVMMSAATAMAQQPAATSAEGAAGQKSGVSVGASGGVTSGPAATGQPATLGTNGIPAAVSGQTDLLRNKGGVAITGEKRVHPAATRKHKASNTPSN